MLRQKATRLFNEQCAIAILANLPDRLNSRDRKDEIDSIAEKTKKDLMLFVEVLQANVQEMRRELGIKVDQKNLLALLDHIQESTKPNYASYVPFWRLSEWISKYDHMGIEPHWRISIDPHGIGRDYPGGFEIRVLEVTMFEDMASLFNMARHAYLTTSGSQSSPKSELKRAVALYRATASAAFYFIECFMNEIAVDYVWGHRAELSANELALLTEWDDQRQRQKFVSTRDKLVLYPRIISGSKHPPLDEGSCPELKFIVGKAKTMRDAIVHASTAREDEVEEYDKETAIMSLKYQTVEEIVDSAVNLIQKVQSATSKVELLWLVGRAEDGYFPLRTFD